MYNPRGGGVSASIELSGDRFDPVASSVRSNVSSQWRLHESYSFKDSLLQTAFVVLVIVVCACVSEARPP